jgi:hypothetical protein
MVVFNAIFNNISVISWGSAFIGGGIQSTKKKKTTALQKAPENPTHLVGLVQSGHIISSNVICFRHDIVEFLLIRR